eukprot:GFUD01024774.1.p1 GENE.GFUD01024774.1~~GFUD01024774.1.p1  ORF type:complete len:142 (+),score=36.40 GFUD01024774.1:122-547(+)
MLVLFFSLFSLADASPSKCELSIVRCCDADFAVRELPLRCFEVNGCPGLYWHGQKTCQEKLVASAISSLNSSPPNTLVTAKNSNRLSISYRARRQNKKDNNKCSTGFCLKRESYLEGHQIRPVLRSRRLFLQISPLANPVG